MFTHAWVHLQSIFLNLVVTGLLGQLMGSYQDHMYTTYKLLSLSSEPIMNSIVADRFLEMTLINFECFFAKHLVRMWLKWCRIGIDLDALS